MATKSGTLQEFQPATDTITRYLQRVELHFVANGVADEKHVPILLSSIGPTTYALLCDLMAPQSPAKKSFADIGKALIDHFELRDPTRSFRMWTPSGKYTTASVSGNRFNVLKRH
jgi:hypothetical protein